MAETRISESEWRSEIERVMGRTSDAGMTSREIAAALGLSVRTTMERLRSVSEVGRLGVGRRAITMLNGRPAWCPVYFVKDAK